MVNLVSVSTRSKNNDNVSTAYCSPSPQPHVYNGQWEQTPQQYYKWAMRDLQRTTLFLQENEKARVLFAKIPYIFNNLSIGGYILSINKL